MRPERVVCRELVAVAAGTPAPAPAPKRTKQPTYPTVTAVGVRAVVAQQAEAGAEALAVLWEERPAGSWIVRRLAADSHDVLFTGGPCQGKAPAGAGATSGETSTRSERLTPRLHQAVLNAQSLPFSRGG